MNLHGAFATALEHALEEEADKEIERVVQHFRRHLERIRNDVVSNLLEHTELFTREDPESTTVELRVTLRKEGITR